MVSAWALFSALRELQESKCVRVCAACVGDAKVLGDVPALGASQSTALGMWL